MTGGILPWLVGVLAAAVCFGVFILYRRRLDRAKAALRTAERELQGERARLMAEADGLQAERAALSQQVDGLLAEVLREKKDRDRLVAVLDSLPLPVWIRGADLALVECNRAYLTAVEADRETVLREGRELGGSAHVEQARALAGLACAARVPQSETHHVVIGGARRLLELTEAPVAEGGTVGVAVDLTHQEEAETELSRHVAAHGEVLENLATAIAIYAPDTRLKFFNTAFANLWRIDESWLRGEPTFGEVLEASRERRRLPEYADFPAFKRQRLRLFTSLLEPLEELIYIPDGTTLRSRILPHPLGGLLFTFEDVTDSLVLERSYNTMIAVQRETLDNLYEGVAVIGSDGRLKLFNPAYSRMWQLSKEFLSGEPHITDLIESVKAFYDDDGDWHSHRDRIAARLTERAARTGRLNRSDGSVLDYAIVPLPDGNMLLSYLDVTDSVRVESALRERTEALETIDRLKSEFIASVSYELRTPLNTILGFAEILDQLYFGPLNERQREYTRGIIESSEGLNSIIGDILDLAMIEAGRMTLERAPVDLPSLLTEVRSIMEDQARIEDLQLVVEEPSGELQMEGDRRRLAQALCNLVSNAIRFTPAGGRISIGARVEGDRAILRVTDTGVGIAGKDQARVFEKFERMRDTGGRKSTGLGLSLVKSLIELHGGRITIESTPERGTTVSCILPVRAAVAAPEIEPDAPQPRRNEA